MTRTDRRSPEDRRRLPREGSEDRRKRGRPQAATPLVRVSVCLSVGAYDAYCKVALRNDQPLAVVLRRVLTSHLPDSD